ncbi:6-bladed beta-propeller [Acanthopleuribacter pedis]|uniref:6-bladed beta-propeller n=1 Tax=Acanthopleuribacter pedis TaxID=442870 RepID=A0A8J7U3M1_9BACT|nr:6-bladed beta-propeller [Acanthopleuribacter pedis]MBO1320568.1 hypothetical protein [Acanthopleuribacter pedis]
MLVLLFSGFLLFGPKSVDLVPVHKLSAIPEDADNFLQNPWDATVSPAGKVYILDLAEATVFHWDESGKFLGNFAKRGQGPGDLMISSRIGGPQASIATRGEELVVYDGGLRKINRFKSDGTFVSAVNFNLARGRTESFRPLNNGNYLIHHRSFGGESSAPTVNVGIFKEDGTEVKELFTMPDTSWKPRKDGERGIVMIGYSRDVFVHYDADADRIIIADTDKPVAQVFDQEGKLQTTVQMKLPRPEVSAEDIAEYREIGWLKNNNWVKLDFPEKHQLFQYIMPDKKNGYMVFRESPVYCNLVGVYVDSNGKTTGRVNLALGEESRIFAARGKFLIIRANEDGDFNVYIAEPKPQTT